MLAEPLPVAKAQVTAITSAPAAPPSELALRETWLTTENGTKVLAPAGWTARKVDDGVELSGPEPGLVFTFVDVQAVDGERAIATAWQRFDPTFSRRLEAANDEAPENGWEHQLQHTYFASPGEKKMVVATAFGKAGRWTVLLMDADQATLERRLSDFFSVVTNVRAKGFAPESFAGKKAHPLNAERLAILTDFIVRAQSQIDVPGVAVALTEGQHVVLEGGFGVRQINRPDPVTSDTRFAIASNTKALTTLLLAKLVDEKKFAWNTKVKEVYPPFRIDSEEATARIQMKHLVCACTGLPRQDLEWQFLRKGVTPAGEMRLLATMKPTTEFGKVFQYNNLIAASAGFIAGHSLYPEMELGAAYDRAMASRVFGPLGMTHTTFNFSEALTANHAALHSWDIDGNTTVVDPKLIMGTVEHRPAGGAWSTVGDMLRYVQIELSRGKLADGSTYVTEEQLDARIEAQVEIGRDMTYGMGLIVGTKWGTPVVHHGGGHLGSNSDMFWFPEHNVGGVIFTNSDTGGVLVSAFIRKLAEVLFDGQVNAEKMLLAGHRSMKEQYAGWRKELTLPPDHNVIAGLARHYKNDALGDITVNVAKHQTVFDFGGWKSQVATRKSGHDVTSIVPILPGRGFMEFIVGRDNGKRTLTLSDLQHHYVFVEK